MESTDPKPVPPPEPKLSPVPPQPKDPDEPPGVGQRWRALTGDGDWIHRAPVRGLFVAAALLLALVLSARSVRSSFRTVPPGEAGVAANTFTGTVRLLKPGSYFLPESIYTLFRVRISDQLLGEREGRFFVTTEDGLAVDLSVQARWAIDPAPLLGTWPALPPDPGKEVVAPILASAFRSAAPAYPATALLASKRDELAAIAAQQARARLAKSGILLKDVFVSGLKLPEEFEKGRLAILQEAQATDKKTATLKLKEQEILETRLVAEAEKVKREKAAEAEAAQKLIAAKGDAEAMQYILPLREKEIEQEKLRAEAEKARRLKQAEGEAEAGEISTKAEAQRRRTMADAEAYAIRTTSLAQFENLKREVELVQANPVWVSKTFAEKISDKVQVILTPQLTSNVFNDEILKRVANGKPAVAPRETAQTSAANPPSPTPVPTPAADPEATPEGTK